MIYRLFKLPANVDRTTSQVIYNGSVTGNEEELKVRNTAQLHENVVGLSSGVARNFKRGGAIISTYFEA